jgi:antirestriction protein ArdC
MGYSCPYWATYKQIVGLGGIVNKGEHGIPVVYWKVLEGTKEEGSEPEGEEDEKKGKKHFILLYHTVFNLMQSTLPIPAFEKNQNDRIDTCEEFIAEHSDKFAPIYHKESARAYYSPSEDIINVPDMGLFDNSESFYSTTFHEIIHSVGSEKRLARFKSTDTTIFGSETYSKEELVAELGASFLNNLNGIETVFDNSVSYLQGWLKALKNDKRMIVFAASAAEKAVEWICKKEKVKV